MILTPGLASGLAEVISAGFAARVSGASGSIEEASVDIEKAETEEASSMEVSRVSAAASVGGGGSEAGVLASAGTVTDEPAFGALGLRMVRTIFF